MQVGHEFLNRLHTDSTASSTRPASWRQLRRYQLLHASGPPPANDAELRAAGAPSIQDVIRTSQISIEQITTLMRKVETLVDTSIPRRVRRRIHQRSRPLCQAQPHRRRSRNHHRRHCRRQRLAGKFITDDTLYNRANSIVGPPGQDHHRFGSGKGSAGKLLKDDTLYNNLNSAVSNANQLVAEINAGKGSLERSPKTPPSPRSSTTQSPSRLHPQERR